MLTIQDDTSTQNQRYVNQLYVDLLARPVDASGLALWGGSLNANLMSHSQVVSGIESSLEYRADVIQGIYQQILRRAADPGGLVFFTNFIGTGGTENQVRAILFGSQEYFANRGSSTNLGFLTALYQDLFNRPIDMGGQAFFLQQLAMGVSRTTIATSLVVQLEAEQVLVNDFYQQLLHRNADTGGLNFLTSLMQTGVREEVAIGILGASDEFFMHS